MRKSAANTRRPITARDTPRSRARPRSSRQRARLQPAPATRQPPGAASPTLAEAARLIREAVRDKSYQLTPIGADAASYLRASASA
jgi:hypothetical protein